MRVGGLPWLALIGSAILVIGATAQATGDHEGRRFDQDGSTLRGLINDHVAVGGWEVHGVWTLHVKGQSQRADFTGALTMEHDDYYLVSTAVVPSPAARHAHTHHLSLVDGDVTALTNGFRVSGPGTVSGNGATMADLGNATFQIDITGGDLVTDSNIALTIGTAVNHFSSDPLKGVVSGTKDDQ
jgi:hypothetical protein